MTGEEKDALSHRRRAWEALVERMGEPNGRLDFRKADKHTDM
jgi:hypothetical protein